MSEYSLKLFPYSKEGIIISLYDRSFYNNINIFDRIDSNSFVYSDLDYEMEFTGNTSKSIKDIYLYVNDVLVQSWLDGTHLYFENKRIFIDCYCFVELSIHLVLEDDSSFDLQSNYIPVLVQKGELNNAVEAMAEYVSDHQSTFFLNGEPQPKGLSDISDGGLRTLDAQISLAEQISVIYERNLGFFRINSRFNIEKKNEVVRMEQLQFVTPSTIEYLVSHPEFLEHVNINTGIRIGKKVYRPTKILSQINNVLYNTYENTIILCFIKRMTDDLTHLYHECNLWFNTFPKTERYESEYIYSSSFIFKRTLKMIETSRDRLIVLCDRFTKIWWSYNKIFNIPQDQLASGMQQFLGTPRPTHIFLSVPQYNQIYNQIQLWKSAGVYDFSKENFMLSLVKVSSLYESYIAIKLIEQLKSISNSYRFYHFTYPTRSSWKYKNVRTNNTFVFQIISSDSESQEVTLFYQPVIYDYDNPQNDIHLYRNNSIPVKAADDLEYGAHYYVPDYLIKISNQKSDKYIIADAKFSNYKSVQKYYIKDLAFKYLFSISPSNNNSKVSGLAIFYGKCLQNSYSRTSYDKQIPGDTIFPFSEIIPMIEGIDDMYHSDRLRGLLNLAFNLQPNVN